MFVAILGIAAECVLLYAVTRGISDNVGAWYFYTITCFILSIALAVNFLLGVLEWTYSYGQNFFADAACTLVKIAHFLVPEEFWGPRLYTVMVAVLLLIHLSLPFYHIYCFCVVKSYLQARAYGFTFRGVDGANNAAHPANAAVNDIEASAPLQVGTITKCGKTLCQKCAIAQGELAMPANGISTPVMINAATGKPIETTC